MIQMQSVLQVADNSGARRVTCILPLGGGVGRIARLGDVITASVREAAPGSAVKKGTVVQGRHREDAQGAPQGGWLLHPLRRQRCGPDQ